MNDVVTYQDIAQWLPSGIREDIEGSLPCPTGPEHNWRRHVEAVEQWGVGVTHRITWSSCLNCGHVIGDGRP